MNKLKALFVIALAVCFTTAAYAETQNVKVSGSIDAYAIMRDNYDLRNGNDSGATAQGTAVQDPNHAGSAVHSSDADQYFMSITQIQVAADLTDNVSTVINLVNQRDWNADQFSTGTTNTANEFNIDLDLAYVSMKEIFYSPLTLTIGRQDLSFGRGFILGWNPQDPASTIQADEFTAITSFDAIRATLDFNPWTVDLVYSKITENSHDPEDDRDLYFANVNYKFAEYNAVAEGYFMSEANRSAVAGSSGTRDNLTDTIGGRAQFDPISQITLGAEFAYQWGDYYQTVGSTGRDRGAYALDIFGTYRWDNSPWKPSATLEYVKLSGEGNYSTTEGYSGWNDDFRGPTYGRIHEYLETYYATAQVGDYASGQNLNILSLSGNMKPMEDLGVTSVLYWFQGVEPIYKYSGQTTTLSTDIGWEWNNTVTYAYTEDVTFAFMADWFFPGDYYDANSDATAMQLISEVKVTF